MAETPRTPRPAPGPARPRLTGRGAILVLVLVVLVVSYASSLRAYLVQRDHIADVKAEIADRQDTIASLEREQRRWEDPAYLRSQARERLGYLMPGETGYQVLDEDGEPLGASTLPAQDVPREEPTAWWDVTWDSVELAGQPPQVAQKEPAQRIGPTGGGKGSGTGSGSGGGSDG